MGELGVAEAEADVEPVDERPVDEDEMALDRSELDASAGEEMRVARVDGMARLRVRRRPANVRRTGVLGAERVCWSFNLADGSKVIVADNFSLHTACLLPGDVMPRRFAMKALSARGMKTHSPSGVNFWTRTLQRFDFSLQQTQQTPAS